MTNSPNQTPNPNPNRRRRLTADELIAIGLAFTGIGTVFFWGIGQKSQTPNLFQAGISSLISDQPQQQSGLLNGNNSTVGASAGTNRQTISSATQTNRQGESPTATTTTTSPAPIINTVEVETPTAVAVAPAIVATIPVVKAPTFTDVPKQFWGETYISALQKRGILDDFGTGKFDPTKEITRGEYAKMLDRAFADKPVTNTTTSFNDIPSDYPRKEAVDKSVQLGFMTGYSAAKFAPNQLIPRYQLQISLAKGLKLPASTNPDAVLSKFTDAQLMPKYAREKMASAVDAGLTIKDQTTNLLKPVQNATRADAAALIYEVLVKEGKIKPEPQQQTPQ
jgi:S-layer homology domain